MQLCNIDLVTSATCNSMSLTFVRQPVAHLVSAAVSAHWHYHDDKGSWPRCGCFCHSLGPSRCWEWEGEDRWKAIYAMALACHVVPLPNATQRCIKPSCLSRLIIIIPNRTLDQLAEFEVGVRSRAWHSFDLLWVVGDVPYDFICKGSWAEIEYFLPSCRSIYCRFTIICKSSWFPLLSFWSDFRSNHTRIYSNHCANQYRRPFGNIMMGTDDKGTDDWRENPGLLLQSQSELPGEEEQSHNCNNVGTWALVELSS